jgi:hypothetical protein
LRKLIVILSFAFVVLLFANINVRAEHFDDTAERITASELKARIDRGENVVIFDVRAREAHGETKIKGAVTMPLNELEGRVSEIPFGALVASYCT